MANVARRAFLKLLPASIMAGPVVAQEAAAKMGLRSVIGGASAGKLVGYAGSPYPQDCNTGTPISEIDWLKERLKSYADPEYLARIRRDMRMNVTRLDPDIASMRGISPSAAYSIQLDREVAKHIDHETGSLKQSLRRLGVPFV